MRVRSARDWEWRRPCASSCRHESALTNTQRCGKGATRVERASVWATEGCAGDLEWRSRRQLAAVPDFRNSKEAQRRVQWSMLDLKQHRQHTIATCKNRGTRQPQHARSSSAGPVARAILPRGSRLICYQKRKGKPPLGQLQFRSPQSTAAAA